MLDSFLTFINQLSPDLSGERTLLAVSGGVDSVVMVDLFYQAGFQVEIAHCNFGLRGEESANDEQFVRELGEKYKLPVFVTRFNTKVYSKTHSISTQMAARELRYSWFEKIRKENGFDWIATAHHANDNLETALLNLARGTGISGFYGILPRNQLLLRPLLFLTKDEIIAYAIDNQLEWREDKSNKSLNYKRNVIREKILPVLKEINPSIEVTFRSTSERVRSADILLSDFLEAWQKEVVNEIGDELRISIDALHQTKEPVYRLWFILNQFGYSYTQVTQVAKSLDSISGKIFYSGSHKLLKDREFLILKPTSEDEKNNLPIIISEPSGTYTFPEGTLSISKPDRLPPFIFEKNRNLIYLDIEKLAFPLSIRLWLAGDIFQPFGMNGKKKKISDLLIDQKLNTFEKEKVHVLTDANGEIVWVIGIRADERHRITTETKEALKVFLEK